MVAPPGKPEDQPTDPTWLRRLVNPKIDQLTQPWPNRPDDPKTDWLVQPPATRSTGPKISQPAQPDDRLSLCRPGGRRASSDRGLAIMPIRRSTDLLDLTLDCSVDPKIDQLRLGPYHPLELPTVPSGFPSSPAVEVASDSGSPRCDV
ncbi:MAG TPA: hypothetical protein VKB75_01240 [Jatrophihabitans sp.]|nr:hypothetical protein [Jatrophihabitans sp.]